MLVQWELTRAGYGLAILPTDGADKAQELIRIASNIIDIDAERWLVSHRDLKSNKKIRAVFNYLAGELSPVI